MNDHGRGYRERRESLPPSAKGFQGVRRSTPWLNEALWVKPEKMVGR